MTSISRRTCYHEAGHAVMALLVGAKIDSVTVVPGPGSRGRTHVKSPTSFGYIMIAAAGSVAECIEFGFDDNKTDLDRDTTLHMHGGVDYEEYQAAARWVLGMHWSAVKRVADALAEKRTLDGDDVKACVVPLEPNGWERVK